MTSDLFINTQSDVRFKTLHCIYIFCNIVMNCLLVYGTVMKSTPFDLTEIIN